MTKEFRRVPRPAERYRAVPSKMCLRVIHQQQLIHCKKFGVGDARVKAAFLVDPVDNTSQTPEGPKYPSAVRALRDAGLPVGVTGAGLTGSCNPADANHQVRECCRAHNRLSRTRELPTMLKGHRFLRVQASCSHIFPSSSFDIGEHWAVTALMGIYDCKFEQPQPRLQLFYGAAGASSWHEVIAGSGHAQFCNAGPILNRVFAALCRSGSQSNRVRRNSVACMCRQVRNVFRLVLCKSCRIEPRPCTATARQLWCHDRPSSLWPCRP